MRIALVITRGDDIGGAQNYVLALAEKLSSDGHELLVVTGTSGVFTEILQKSDIHTVSIPQLSNSMNPLNDLNAVRTLARLLTQFNADLVSLHSSKAGMVGRLAARLAGRPVVFTVHGWAFTPGVREPLRTVYQIIERILVRWTDRVICVSNHSRELALARGFPSKKLVTIHNGLDQGSEPSETNRSASAVMVARFAEPKLHASLIRAAKRVSGLEVHFIGDGPEMMSCQELARELGVEDRIVFHGFMDQVGLQLPKFGVFVLLSRHEGFPLSTLEAMRAGLPVIVSNVGGAPEAVQDGVNGFVVDNGDEDALVDRLQRLRDSSELRSSMGAASRKLFLERFTFDQMYQETLKVYEHVSSTRRFA